MTGHRLGVVERTILDEVLGLRPDLIEHRLAHAVRNPNGRVSTDGAPSGAKENDATVVRSPGRVKVWFCGCALTLGGPLLLFVMTAAEI
jgi:hypothetical protein